MINPDTLRQIKLANCGRRCNDFDTDCGDVEDKFACWMRDPTQGVCPYLARELAPQSPENLPPQQQHR